jgi:hypothetical protein
MKTAETRKPLNQREFTSTSTDYSMFFGMF